MGVKQCRCPPRKRLKRLPNSCFPVWPRLVPTSVRSENLNKILPPRYLCKRTERGKTWNLRITLYLSNSKHLASCGGAIARIRTHSPRQQTSWITNVYCPSWSPLLFVYYFWWIFFFCLFVCTCQPHNSPVIRAKRLNQFFQFLNIMSMVLFIILCNFHLPFACRRFTMLLAFLLGNTGNQDEHESSSNRWLNEKNGFFMTVF